MNIQTADLCDAHEDKLAVVAPMFARYGGRPSFGGPIATLKIFEDNSFVRKAVEGPGDGRVLVIDGGGSLRRSMLGDMLAEKAVANGWSGVLVHGAIRDSAAIAELDLGVKAIATCPMKTDKQGQGLRDVPVEFGGLVIRPGDWLAADEDGVVLADAPLA